MVKYIKRNLYIDRVKPFINKQLIKVFTGQRRVGKSYILIQIADEIRNINANANIIFINREQEQYLHIHNHDALFEFLKDKFIDNGQNYLFIDEVQEIKSFQLVLRSLLAENKCDIYCTGSNAMILSGELATFLGGRYIAFDVHSLSYQEFIEFHKLENTQDSILKYLNYGGMPYLADLGLDRASPFEYLQSVYSTILLKDVVARENIRNISFLENLVYYLANNVGTLFSAANISKFLKSQQINISPQLTLNYLKALCNAYFIYKVPRSEIGGLKIFEIGEKYYFEDLGMRNAICGFNQIADMHKILENAVFLHLIQKGYRVYVGKTGNNEIDFVADKQGLKLYIQVCLYLQDENTINREFGNLLAITDNYPKYVVTFNDIRIGDDYKGIKHFILRDFLTMDI